VKVTAFDCALLPMALVATKRQVYDLPVVRPVTVSGVTVRVAVCVPPPLLEVHVTV
jgi:hypothetical protein